MAHATINPFIPRHYTPEEVTAYRDSTNNFLDGIFNRKRNLVEWIIDEAEELKEELIEEVKEELEDHEEPCADGEVCKNGFKYFETRIEYGSNSFPVNSNNQNTANDPGVGEEGDFSNDVYSVGDNPRFIGKMRGTCIFEEQRELFSTCLFTIVFVDMFLVEMGQLQFQSGGGNHRFEITDYKAGSKSSGQNGSQHFSITGGTGCFSGAAGQASYEYSAVGGRFEITLYEYWYHQYYYYNN
eukprot:CAMPEP_0194359482 /NCGR_PEP_ID=MMETSP0174-20130528/6716_1 /TAXON_ID=216777 /ORGANISM="Proboscia alata, Strain PI-D3" /LENGTH=240 /DNA_ID=CAMNT_0039130387 /DNA_START=186 /DNA_END=908 /DNA_ORIENTATION=-